MPMANCWPCCNDSLAPVCFCPRADHFHFRRCAKSTIAAGRGNNFAGSRRPDSAAAAIAFAGGFFPPAARHVAAGTQRRPHQPAAAGARQDSRQVREYQALGPDERELRLRATELRWYLTPLLHVPAAERAERLAQVPEDLRGLVQSRLAQWDILPPSIQQEFLTNDQTLHYFARIEPAGTPAANPEQQKIAEQFNQFFELTPAEKRRTLGTLSDAERAQMKKPCNRSPSSRRRNGSSACATTRNSPA